MENSVPSDSCLYCNMGFNPKSPLHVPSCKFSAAKRKKREVSKEKVLDKALAQYKAANKRLSQAY